MIASPRGPRCVAADAVAGEIARHIPRLRRSDAASTRRCCSRRCKSCPLTGSPRPTTTTDAKRPSSASPHATPTTGPTVALALKLGLPVWSQDKDLTTAGLDVFTTGELLDGLRDARRIE